MTEETSEKEPENQDAKPESQGEDSTPPASESAEAPEKSEDAAKAEDGEADPVTQSKPLYDFILGAVVIAAVGLAALFYSMTPRGAEALLIDTNIKFNSAKKIYKRWEDADKAQNEKSRKKYLREAHNEFLAITKLTEQLRKLPDYVDAGTPKFKDAYKDFDRLEKESAAFLATLKKNAKDGDIKKKAE